MHNTGGKIIRLYEFSISSSYRAVIEAKGSKALKKMLWGKRRDSCKIATSINLQLTESPERQVNVASLVWMIEEDDQLRAAAVSGDSIAAISKRLCRSERAIDYRARKLGIAL